MRIANENGWGYGRIVGEVKKLGIAVAKSTVKDILREHGFDLGPKRGRGTWADFVDRHAKTLWACDFFQKNIWPLEGYVDFFALFFIHVGSRRVFLGGTTPGPLGRRPQWDGRVADLLLEGARSFRPLHHHPIHLQI